MATPKIPSLSVSRRAFENMPPPDVCATWRCFAPCWNTNVTARPDQNHAFANIALTDNVVRFATRRYCENPLIVQGPGAGPEVTAAGVFSDLLRLSAYLGAHI